MTKCKMIRCDDPPFRLGVCQHHWEWLNGIPGQVTEVMKDAVRKGNAK